MIRLTQLNGKPIVVNTDLVLSIEALPDTYLLMATGTQIIVRESIEEVIERVVEFRQRIATGSPLGTSLGDATPAPVGA